MPRKGLIHSIRRECRGMEDDDSLYVIAYDFPGDHIPTYFYKQLNDLRKAGIRFARGTRSTLLVFGTRSAYAIQAILRHWGCEIDVYKAEKISSVIPEKEDGEKA